jgi:hypothetical protein
MEWEIWSATDKLVEDGQSKCKYMQSTLHKTIKNISTPAYPNRVNAHVPCLTWPQNTVSNVTSCTICSKSGLLKESTGHN